MNKLAPVTILLADDDPDDRFLAQNALEQSRLRNNIYFVADGEELMDFLEHKGKYTSEKDAPTPDLILLDLNMPKKSGVEALKLIRENEQLKHIPVVILTTSEAEQDILDTYKLGVNSFITKPVSFEGLIEVMKVLKRYWFQIVKLPHDDSNN
jgi:CheY-like chemotaxis protein